MQTGGRLGGKFWNEVQDAIRSRFEEMRDFYRAELLVDGFPPFTEPVDERREYEKLVALRMIPNSPFWQSPAAQQRLEQLAAKFGPPPAPLAPPFGGMPFGGM